MNPKPHVGIAVIIMRDNTLLLGKRKGSHGHGNWAFPGGHLEYGESWEECAKREVKEETNLDIEDVCFLTATNDIFEKEEKHYITLFLVAKNVFGEPRIMEKNKCEEWKWFAIEDLPSPLFLPIKNLMMVTNNLENLFI